jgi:hypothetical protein
MSLVYQGAIGASYRNRLCRHFGITSELAVILQKSVFGSSAGSATLLWSA